MSGRSDRVLDLALGSLLLVAALPAILAAATLVMLTSGLPVLFRQQRIGKGGVPFSILKFRSMVRNAEQLGWPPAEVACSSLGRARRRDPRITWAGRVIRRLSLDELPQLLNVLKGEMSLVGPRPVPLPEWERVSLRPELRHVHHVRPGLTGPYQLAVRRGFGAEEARLSEAAYVGEHTVWDYLRVLLLTPSALLKGGGDILHPPLKAEVERLSAEPALQVDGDLVRGDLAALRRLYRVQVSERTMLFDPVLVRAFQVDKAAHRVIESMRNGSYQASPKGMTGPEQEAFTELLHLGRWLENVSSRVGQLAGLRRRSRGVQAHA